MNKQRVQTRACQDKGLLFGEILRLQLHQAALVALPAMMVAREMCDVDVGAGAHLHLFPQFCVYISTTQEYKTGHLIACLACFA